MSRRRCFDDLDLGPERDDDAEDYRAQAERVRRWHANRAAHPHPSDPEHPDWSPLEEDECAS